MLHKVFEIETDGLVLAVRVACVPSDHDNFTHGYGHPVGVAVWWAKYVMRRARAMKLYPTTELLEWEARRRAA